MKKTSEGSYASEEAFHLLNQFESILESDPLIDEVGFIHPSQFITLNEEAGGTLTSFDETLPQLEDGISRFNRNTSFWSKDHKLGISTQVLLPLYKAVKSNFMATLGQYKQLSQMSNELEVEKNSFSVDTLESDIMKHTKALLLLSCDFGTAWNARKLIVSKRQQTSNFMDELILSALVLSYAAKSEQAWSHRRWVIKMVASKSLTLQEIVGKESELVKAIAERSKMNYRAWNHRCWLVSYMTKEQVLHELKESKNWAGLHVADSSCFHYRRLLLIKILKNFFNKQGSNSSGSHIETYQVWKEELGWNEELIKRYVGREALWLHRRFLSLCWMNHFASDLHGFSSHFDENTMKDSGSAAIFIDNEIRLVNSCSTIPDNDFEDFEAQAMHSTTYILWLTKQLPEFQRGIQANMMTGNLKILRQNETLLERSFVWDHLTDSPDIFDDGE